MVALFHANWSVPDTCLKRDETLHVNFNKQPADQHEHQKHTLTCSVIPVSGERITCARQSSAAKQMEQQLYMPPLA